MLLETRGYGFGDDDVVRRSVHPPVLDPDEDITSIAQLHAMLQHLPDDQ